MKNTKPCQYCGNEIRKMTTKYNRYSTGEIEEIYDETCIVCDNLTYGRVRVFKDEIQR